MGKKSNQDEGSKKENLKWTAHMDGIFIEALLQQHRTENRVDGTFTTTAYDNILAELKQNLGMELSKQHLKNRMKTLKTKFNEWWYDMFKGTKFSGFSWNPVTKLLGADAEVWKPLLEVCFQNLLLPLLLH